MIKRQGELCCSAMLLIIPLGNGLAGSDRGCGEKFPDVRDSCTQRLINIVLQLVVGDFSGFGEPIHIGKEKLCFVVEMDGYNLPLLFLA